jgi:hypothetical protein
LVKSELYQLEKLIGNILNDEPGPGKEQQFSEQVKSILVYCESLKEKWTHELFHSVKEPVAARYVQYHQAGVTSLSNLVSLKIPAGYFKGIEDQIHQLYLMIVSHLEDLLRFLKQGFYKYFDHDYPVSIDYCRERCEKVRLLVAELTISLQHSGVDEALVSAISSSFTHKLADAKQSGISYRQLDYCSALPGITIQLLRDRPDIDTMGIAHELYRQNFNSYYFCQWYQGYYGSRINSAAENKKETVIRNEIKQLQLIFVKLQQIFEPELLPVHEQLIPWLQQLLPGQSGLTLKQPLKMNGHERMPLKFSVTQFAFFVRLCYLEGCFPVNNISDILRFFTRNFETKKQLNVSFKSFARAFYGANQATAAVVRDFLQRMINHINKTYFP